MTIFYTQTDSPLGKLMLIGNEKILLAINIPGSKHNLKKQPQWIKDNKPFKTVIDQLDRYFTGQLKKFSLKLGGQGTDFQKSVWSELLKIPYGKTVSYSQIAQKIGKPRATRAVANAIGKNPIPIIVPCHRVIGSNGSLTGYASGLKHKKQLLAIEEN